MSNYLFCFLKEDKRTPAVNQRRAVEVCRKIGCGYLDEGKPEPECTCQPSTEYFLAFKKRKKVIDHEEESKET